MKKILAFLLAAVMVLSLVACNKQNKQDETRANPYLDIENYDELSKAVYEDILGDFYAAYQEAEAAATDSQRWALMAVAEAKLLGSGVVLPLTTNGGNYEISRVAPYTTSTVLWGNDAYRYHNAVVATELLTAAHRNEIKSKWVSMKGTGNWETWVKDFLINNGYSLKSYCALNYSADPQNWDILATNKTADIKAIANTYEGLVAYDAENQLKPALAESWEVSEDGLTYTFKIREGIKWVDSLGREIGTVKADDFVAGLQHMMDAKGGLEKLVKGLIVNADKYISGEVADFKEVGVKAVDDTTLVYTLCQPASYFMTMLNCSAFAPMNRDYYASQGGKFGGNFDSEADDYNYGKTYSNIAYCGPYIVSSLAAEETILFQANKKYWDAENVNIQTLAWQFNNGADETKAYNDLKEETIDICSLTAASVETAKAEEIFSTYAYISDGDASSSAAFVNLYRASLANFNDPAAVVSGKTDEQIERTRAAMLNRNFRLALATAANRGAYNAQMVGEDLKLASLRNTYTPGNFVALTEEVTIPVGGEDKTYAAGTQYGKIVQDQLDADGVKITVWNAEAEFGQGSSDGFDGWYNAETAAEYMEAAIEELNAKGVEITKRKPIYLDLPILMTNESYVNRAKAYKESVEEALDGKVMINLVECENIRQWYSAYYYPATGAEGNYDICELSTKGSNYGDPKTYLETMLPDYAGSMTKAIGLF